MRGERLTDRRVQRTQHLLREALVSLIREKNYDAIAVKEILDRANVGRSTFYTHFNDKDALLASGIHEMLRSAPSPRLPGSAKPHEKLLWFGLPIFEYHEEHRRDARMGRRGRIILHQHLHHVLTDLIADDVRRYLRRAQPHGGTIPADLVVQYIVSTFILVLNWWLESRSPLAPRQVNDVFRALVLPTLAAMCE